MVPRASGRVSTSTWTWMVRLSLHDEHRVHGIHVIGVTTHDEVHLVLPRAQAMEGHEDAERARGRARETMPTVKSISEDFLQYINRRLDLSSIG